MVYDVTYPAAARFVQYRLDRDFSATPGPGTGGPLGPEGLLFVPASAAPRGKPMLLVANEIGGTTSSYEIGLLLP